MSIKDDADINLVEETQSDWEEGSLTDTVIENDNLLLREKSENILYFDGDDYVEIPDSSDFSGGSEAVITVEVYFKAQDVGNLVEKQWDASDGDWGITINDNNELEYYSEDGGGDYNLSGGDVTTDTWHHGCFVLQQDIHELRIYLDGELVAEDTSIGQISASTGGNVYIGARFYDNSDSKGYFNEGSIRYVRIWNTARTQQEIQDNIETELEGNESGLVALYKIDEGSGDTLYDSANNHDGTINGATWSSESLGLYSNGTRTSPQLDLSSIKKVKDTLIEWEGETEDGGHEEYNGISKGYDTDDLTFYKNQWDGSSNDGEIDIDGSQFTLCDGTTRYITPINNGVALQDDESATGFLMYSEENVHDRFSPHNDNCDHLVGVKYEDDKWYYDDNNNWNEFTPVESDHLICEVEWGIESIEKLDGSCLPTTSITIETRHSLDNGDTWSDWEEATKGDPIPGLTEDTDVSKGMLECRQILETSDTDTSPELQNLGIYLVKKLLGKAFFMFGF